MKEVLNKLHQLTTMKNIKTLTKCLDSNCNKMIGFRAITKYCSRCKQKRECKVCGKRFENKINFYCPCCKDALKVHFTLMDEEKLNAVNPIIQSNKEENILKYIKKVTGKKSLGINHQGNVTRRLSHESYSTTQ